MVSDQPTVPQSTMTELLVAIRRGLESLTLTHSAVLDSIHAEALRAVMEMPTLGQRELMLSQAWTTSAKAIETFQAANATQETQEMYRLVRLAISASYRDRQASSR
jgi:hypothetical protein